MELGRALTKMENKIISCHVFALQMLSRIYPHADHYPETSFLSNTFFQTRFPSYLFPVHEKYNYFAWTVGRKSQRCSTAQFLSCINLGEL